MLSDYVKSADWQNEKHVPVIECEDFKPGEPLNVFVTVGKGIPHQNTPAHHICWIALHFVPQGAKASIELARCEFSAHGASAGEQPGPALTDSVLAVTARLAVPGKLFATSYCNIHGLWSSEKDLA